jgi:hypothetical protein
MNTIGKRGGRLSSEAGNLGTAVLNSPAIMCDQKCITVIHDPNPQHPGISARSQLAILHQYPPSLGLLLSRQAHRATNSLPRIPVWATGVRILFTPFLVVSHRSPCRGSRAVILQSCVFELGRQIMASIRGPWRQKQIVTTVKATSTALARALSRDRQQATTCSKQQPGRFYRVRSAGCD